jgi:hypothetical protein
MAGLSYPRSVWPVVAGLILLNKPDSVQIVAGLMPAKVLPCLGPYRFGLNQNRALTFYFDAFSSREPVPTSLENALVWWVRNPTPLWPAQQGRRAGIRDVRRVKSPDI